MTKEIQCFFKEVSYILTPKEYQYALEFFSDQRSHIREKIEMLSWDTTDENQQLAIEYLASHMLPSEYIYLVFADRCDIDILDRKVLYLKYCKDKSKWENAAKTIVKIGWPNIEHIMVPIFYWLLDSNWPGSMTIYQFLLSLPKSVLCSQIKKILDNPQWFQPMDYQDLKMQIEDLCFDAKIQMTEDVDRQTNY